MYMTHEKYPKAIPTGKLALTLTLYCEKRAGPTLMAVPFLYAPLGKQKNYTELV